MTKCLLMGGSSPEGREQEDENRLKSSYTKASQTDVRKGSTGA